MKISGFDRFGSRNPESGTLKNALDYLGITAQHSFKPYSEELLFGIGGGIGFAYFLFEKNGNHPIHLGTRIHTKETERPEFLLDTARRLGVTLKVQNSSSASAAASNLKRQLDQGWPVMVSVDPSRLPYLGLDASLNSYYSIIVYGLDEQTGEAMISDRCPRPVTANQDQLRWARETSWSPKYRGVTVEMPPPRVDIRTAVTEGITACCRQMNEGLGITNFGLRGLEKWANVLVSAKEKKSWPKIFSPGATLWTALYSMFTQIRGRCDTGNANRSYYAAFLDEAAGILGNNGLRGAAEQYRNCDQMWQQVADAHLPESVPQFAEARQLTLRRRKLFESQGMDAQAEISQIHARLNAIGEEVSNAFPMSFQDSRSLLNDLRARILKLKDAETEAVRALESAINPSGAEQEHPHYAEGYHDEPETVGSQHL